MANGPLRNPRRTPDEPMHEQNVRCWVTSAIIEQQLLYWSLYHHITTRARRPELRPMQPMNRRDTDPPRDVIFTVLTLKANGKLNEVVACASHILI